MYCIIFKRSGLQHDDDDAEAPSKICLSIHVLGKLLLVGLAGGKLEVQNVTLVQLDLLFVADVDLLGALRDEAHIVTDHEDSSLELLEAALCNYVDNRMQGPIYKQQK